MTRVLSLALLALLLALPAGAQAPAPPSRGIFVFADLGDQGQFGLENQLMTLLWDRLGSGGLSHVGGLAPQPAILNVGQPDGRKLMARLGIAPELLPALAVADLDAQGQPRAALWVRKVFDAAVEVRAMLAYFGVDPDAGQPLIRAASFQPQGLGRPLRAGEVVTLTVQGAPGGTVTATLGGRTGLPLFEDPPGLYRTTYTVSPEDRTTAEVSVDFLARDGREDRRDLGSVVLQGLLTPEVQLVQQVGSGQWLVTGMAPPNSQVVVTAEVVTGVLMFKDVQRQQFLGVSDANGQFQARGPLSGDLDGATGRFRVQATDPSGNSVSSPEREVRLVADSRWSPQPSPQPQPWNPFPPYPGGSVQAFSDSSGLYVVSGGQRTRLESMSPRWYQAVGDLVVYSSFMNDLKVWWNGQTSQLETMSPKSWKADTGTLAYVNFMGNFLVWHQGQVTRLGNLEPQSYEVGPGALAFVGANRGFFLWLPGSGVRQLEAFPPQSYRIWGRTLQYSDPGGFQRVVPF